MDNCHECDMEFTKQTLKKYNGKCRKCYKNNYDKCSRCHTEYTKKTLKKYDGICGRCSKSTDGTHSRTIPKSLRMEVWKDHVGDSLSGNCYCCRNIMHVHEFECGHIIAHRDGGNIEKSNLKPVCISCNRSMGTMNLEEFKKLFETPQQLLNNIIQTADNLIKLTYFVNHANKTFDRISNGDFIMKNPEYFNTLQNLYKLCVNTNRKICIIYTLPDKYIWTLIDADFISEKIANNNYRDDIFRLFYGLNNSTSVLATSTHQLINIGGVYIDVMGLESLNIQTLITICNLVDAVKDASLQQQKCIFANRKVDMSNNITQSGLIDQILAKNYPWGSIKKYTYTIICIMTKLLLVHYEQSTNCEFMFRKFTPELLKIWRDLNDIRKPNEYVLIIDLGKNKYNFTIINDEFLNNVKIQPELLNICSRIYTHADCPLTTDMKIGINVGGIYLMPAYLNNLAVDQLELIAGIMNLNKKDILINAINNNIT